MAHDLAHAVPRGRANRRRLALVLGLTLAFLGVEVAAGLLTGSLALLADAGHMLTDVAGLILALAAMKFAERPPSPRRTYGYHRVEILAALTNGLVLLAVAGFILLEAWQRFQHPTPVASVCISPRPLWTAGSTQGTLAGSTRTGTSSSQIGRRTLLSHRAG